MASEDKQVEELYETYSKLQEYGKKKDASKQEEVCVVRNMCDYKDRARVLDVFVIFASSLQSILHRFAVRARF